MPAPGMVIAVDPETGALVAPTGIQRAKLGAAEPTGLLRTDQGLREVRLADGSVMIDLQGRFLEYAVARIGPDGCLRLGCVDGGPAPPPPIAPCAPAAPEER